MQYPAAIKKLWFYHPSITMEKMCSSFSLLALKDLKLSLSVITIILSKKQPGINRSCNYFKITIVLRWGEIHDFFFYPFSSFFSVFFSIYIYLFILTVPGLSCSMFSCSMQTLSWGMHVGSGIKPGPPCIGSTESYPLHHQGSPLLSPVSKFLLILLHYSYINRKK